MTVEAPLTSEGIWKLNHVYVVTCDGRLHLLSDLIPQTPGVGFVVKSKPPTVKVEPLQSRQTLLAGVEQKVVLSVNVGSERVSSDSNLVLKVSPGLTVQLAEQDAPLQSELQVPLQSAEPFDTVDVPLRVVADLEEQHDESPIEGEVRWKNYS